MSESAVDAQTWCDISGVIAEHGWRIDHGLIMDAFKLYASEPRLVFNPPAPRAGTYAGREAVEGWFVERAKNSGVKCRHAISNIRMIQNEDGSVTATHLMVLFRDGMPGMKETDPVFVADAEERFVKEGGAWKIAERIVTPVFSPA